MVSELIGRHDIERARQLVGDAGLRFEDDFDTLVGVFEETTLAGVGARAGNILKMLTIAPEFQGGALLGELVGELIRSGFNTGHSDFFIYTRPSNAASFQSLNFHPLVHHPQVTLLEHGHGLRSYLEAYRDLVAPGRNGALVMNCNPFTLGHRYLVERAAEQVDRLYLFVVREDRSAFPFETRFRLVREGTAHLANVRVLDSSHFAVSSLTFPAYFLKAGEDVSQIQMEVDVLLFACHLAPYFHVTRRFFGSEPYCRTTRLYNETMKLLLPGHGIEAVELERVTVEEQAISAYRVREALRHEAYEMVRRLVPATTLQFLMSEEARPLREKLRTYQRRH